MVIQQKGHYMKRIIRMIGTILTTSLLLVNTMSCNRADQSPVAVVGYERVTQSQEETHSEPNES